MRRLNRQNPRAYLTYEDDEENEYRVKTSCCKSGNSKPEWGNEYKFFHSHTGAAELIDSSFKLEVVHCTLDRCFGACLFSCSFSQSTAIQRQAFRCQETVTRGKSHK